MPQDTKSNTPLAGPESFGRGTAVDGTDRDGLAAAMLLAMEYRGDVSFTLVDGGRVVEGYVYDLRNGDPPLVRMLVKDSEERLAVPLDGIARLEVTGRDTAAGKSFESWVKRYVEKKLAGEKANIESDPL